MPAKLIFALTAAAWCGIGFATATTPAALPGKGPAQHPFLYAGEWDTRKPLEQSSTLTL